MKKIIYILKIEENELLLNAKLAKGSGKEVSSTEKSENIKGKKGRMRREML